VTDVVVAVRSVRAGGLPDGNPATGVVAVRGQGVIFNGTLLELPPAGAVIS
jgi:hypothetical protein